MKKQAKIKMDCKHSSIVLNGDPVIIPLEKVWGDYETTVRFLGDAIIITVGKDEYRESLDVPRKDYEENSIGIFEIIMELMLKVVTKNKKSRHMSTNCMHGICECCKITDRMMRGLNASKKREAKESD